MYVRDVLSGVSGAVRVWHLLSPITVICRVRHDCDFDLRCVLCTVKVLVLTECGQMCWCVSYSCGARGANILTISFGCKLMLSTNFESEMMYIKWQ